MGKKKKAASRLPVPSATADARRRLLRAVRCWLRLGRRDRAEESFKELLAGDYEPALQEPARRFVQR